MAFEIRSIHRVDGLLLVLVGTLDEDATAELLEVVGRAPRGIPIDVQDLLATTDEGIAALRRIERSGAILLNPSPGLRGLLGTTPATGS